MEGQFSDGGGRGGRGGGGGGRGRGQGRGRGRGGPAQKKKSTKNQMRSIQRLLAREGLPEKVRLEKTRELEALTGVAVENKQSERERKMAVRYHKVKFFERVKLTRSIEKLERDNPGGERSAEVDAQLARLREDLRTCSTSRRDISTCPSSSGRGDTEHLERKREKLRQKIKENMVADAALAEANEGGEAAAAAAAAMGASAAAVVEKDDFFMADDD